MLRTMTGKGKAGDSKSGADSTGRVRSFVASNASRYLSSTRKSPSRVPYNRSFDLTLTAKQIMSDLFGDPGKFRYPSNPTILGHSSGYHESVLTTDNYFFFRNAVDNKDGTSSLRALESYNAIFRRYNKVAVDSKLLNIVMEIGDKFRTDTARTILSNQKGTASGHAGSGTDTHGQAEAHDLLRNAVMSILTKAPSNAKGVTKRSIIGIFASITITSMAPGELAKGLHFQNELKDFAARRTWEHDRNNAKLLLDKYMATLDNDEKEFVLQHASNFMDSTKPAIANVGQTGGRGRTLNDSGGRQRARSPLRDGVSFEYDYSLEGRLSNPQEIANDIDFPLQVTANFRADRRVASV